MSSFKENAQALMLASLVACHGPTQQEVMYAFFASGAMCFIIWCVNYFLKR